MSFRSFRTLAIIGGMFAPLMLVACDSATVSIGGHDGVPLAQLNLSGRTIGEITDLGPDTVHVLHGDKLDIRVEGDTRAATALRFVLSPGKLGIAREPGVDLGDRTATITITTPSLDHLVVAGSGTMSTDRLSGAKVGVTIGGSGRVEAAGIDAAQLDVEMLGSGTLSGSGHAGNLALALAGSGSVDMAKLKVDQATVDVNGTGNAEFASDGPVKGSVNGTGSLSVHGKAQCAVEVNGTGRIDCQP